jgi:hypothetical protein
VNDRFQVQLFGSEYRKPVAHPVPALVAEYADSARSRAVFFFDTFVQCPLQQIEILSHKKFFYF